MERTKKELAEDWTVERRNLITGYYHVDRKTLSFQKASDLKKYYEIETYLKI